MESKHKYTHNGRPAAAKLWLKDLLSNNTELLALYAYHSGRIPRDLIEDAEHIAQFMMRLAEENFIDFKASLVLPEPLFSFLFHPRGSDASFFEKNLKLHYFETHNTYVNRDWNSCLYCEILLRLKLLRICDFEQKSLMREAFKEKLKSYSFGSETSNVDPTSPLASGNPTSLSLNTVNRLANLKIGVSGKSFTKKAITIFGFHRSLMGIGEDARVLFDLLTEKGFRVELYDCSYKELERASASEFYELFETPLPTAEIAIMCMPLFEMARLMAKLPSDFFSSRYTIGYWPWELSSFPEGWEQIIDRVNEVWASSSFLEGVFEKLTKKPVFKMPLCVELDAADVLPRDFHAENKKPNDFICVFDFNSSIHRKNPIGAIRAFKLAFPDRGSDQKLVLKSMNGKMNQEALNSVIFEIGSDPRITLIDEVITRHELYKMIRESKAFLSLHRAEGFGRLLAESMLLGVPVIATNWSGSCDFIKADHSFVVDFNLRKVDRHEYPYAAGEWAEPNLEHAASEMKRIAYEQIPLSSVIHDAKLYIRANFSKNHVATLLEGRLREISISI